MCSCKDAKAEGTFIGVKNSQTVSKTAVFDEKNCIYQFEIKGETKDFCVKNDADYTIQNRLMKGYEYYLEFEDNKITAVELVDKSCVKGIVNGYTPGKRTLKNFLSVAVAPLGKTQYIYGGGWNVQDNGSSFLARTIGISPTWEKFYNSTDASYSYKTDTYPVNGWNEYYFAGLDCSGFVGWTLYNTMCTETEAENGFVCSARTIAESLETKGYGTFNHSKETDYKKLIHSLHPGDVVSMEGHTYIIFGVCEDDSAVIIHSSVVSTAVGGSGGGVQLSAISANGDTDTDCDAYKLAKRYMEENFPSWSAKYPVAVRAASRYLDFPDTYSSLGIFTWNYNETGLKDDENIKNMSAGEILELIFGK